MVLEVCLQWQTLIIQITHLSQKQQAMFNQPPGFPNDLLLTNAECVIDETKSWNDSISTALLVGVPGTCYQYRKHRSK